MTLLLLAYLGGVLTILSPCILPVLPFVFARSDRPFVSSGLPTLLGMAATFAGVASLAAIGGGWAVSANEYGRLAAMVLLTLFGLALLFPSLSERLTRPLVALGALRRADPGPDFDRRLGDPAERRDRRSHVRNPVSRSRRPGLRFHLRIDHRIVSTIPERARQTWRRIRND